MGESGGSPTLLEDLKEDSVLRGSGEGLGGAREDYNSRPKCPPWPCTQKHAAAAAPHQVMTSPFHTQPRQLPHTRV